MVDRNILIRNIMPLLAATLVLVCSVGCKPPIPVTGQVENVELAGRMFKLELSNTNDSRELGLSGRSEIASDGGMLFVFPEAKPLRFWMRNCLTDMDIMYIDPLGHITAFYTMTIEPPQRDDETDFMYESRLPGYPSGYDAQYVIELAPGTINELGLKRGEKLPLDLERFKKIATTAEYPPTPPTR